MADFLRNILGGSKPAQPVAQPDADFADFAGAPEPRPVAHAADGRAASATLSGSRPVATGVPWTKWYNIHERHSLSEFRAEGVILIIMAVVLLVHLYGARANRAKAKKWMAAHAGLLTSEYALVGFGGVPIADPDTVDSDRLIKEKSLYEFSTYASGRQNTAFTDVKLTLVKRFNPFVNYIEAAFAFFSTTFVMPSDSLEACIYPFDGREQLTVPSVPGAEEIRGNKDSKSTYDGFVWAIVHKSAMEKLRNERYDVSLTTTKDSPKLPNWLSVMSENAEITDALLTPELIDAVKAAGDHFEYIVVSDQPKEKPATLKETTPRKRILFQYSLPSNNNYDDLLPLFAYYVRLPDFLAQNAHFRPEVTRKIGKVREQVVAQLNKVAEDEKNEERLLEREKAKKTKRDAELGALDAKAQKKYLEKERDKEQRKMQKKQTSRG